MKKLFLIAFCVTLAYNVSAQDKNASSQDKKVDVKKALDDAKKKDKGKSRRQDRFVLDLFSDIWMNAPTDSMKIKQINRGANAYFMYEFPFGKSNFSFAPGIGIGCTNLYSNAMPVKSFKYDSLGAKVYDGTTVFKKIPTETLDNNQKINVKNNKFTIISLDVPLEFRYRTKNNQFKIYLGGKVGLTLTNYTKYNGDNFNENYPTGSLRYKEYKIANVASYRYGLTARIGWKWVQAFGYYSLSNLFKKDKGPDMYPISVGISITPY